MDVRHHYKEKFMSIWTILFVILLIAWIGGLTVFHVAGGLIHRAGIDPGAPRCDTIG